MTRLKLGVILEQLQRPPREGLSAASALSVNGVQVSAGGELAPAALGETARREFRTLLKSYNLELSAVACPLRHGVDERENQQPRLEQVRRGMQLACDLGARKIILPCPALPTDAAAPRALILRESLTDLSQFGDRIGCLVALECGLDAAAKVREYVSSFATGSLAVNFDPANFLMNGHDPYASATALGDKIVHTHARDARTATAQGGPREVPVGAGDIEWMLFVATLEAIQYRGYLVVERGEGNDTATDVAAGVRFLRRFAGPA